MLDFRCGVLPNYRRIDRTFLSEEIRLPWLARGMQSLLSYLATSQVSRVLVLEYANHSVISLGFEAHFKSLGTGPAAFAAGWRRAGYGISYPFLHM